MAKRALKPVSFLLQLGVVFLVGAVLAWLLGRPALDLVILGVLCLVAAVIWHVVARSRARPRFRDDRLEEVHDRDSVEVIGGTIGLLALCVRFLVTGYPGVAIMYIVMGVLGTFVALRLVRATNIEHPRRRKSVTQDR